MLIKPVSLIQDVEAALALRVEQARLWAQLLDFLGYKLAEWIKWDLRTSSPKPKKSRGPACPGPPKVVTAPAMPAACSATNECPVRRSCVRISVFQC